MGGNTLKLPAPNSEPQRLFFTSEAKYVGYGGARGGGKSLAMRVKFALLAFNYAGIRLLLLRKTFPELEENHIKPLRLLLHGFATYRERDKCFTFPNGSTLRFGYCDREADVDQYQGQEYDIIGFDEATHFTFYMVTVILACLRGVNNFPKRCYMTGNPGGIGHAWYKRLFITKDYLPTENPADYVFIPAKVYDNADLMHSNPEYVNMLENLPADLRRAWLDGDWDVFAGQYFTEWRREVHTMEPMPLPAHWRRYFTMDYGLDMLAGYWVAVDENGFAVVYRELYEGKDNNKGANGGGLLISEAAARILELTPPGEHIEAYFAPPDLWNRRQDTGRSVADIFGDSGIWLTKVNNSREQGWLEVKEWLHPVQMPDGSKEPKMRVFNTCLNLIESMPNMLHDERNPNDCAKEPHEFTHAPDAIRYFIAGRPWAAGTQMPEQVQRAEYYNEQIDDFLNFGI